MNATLAGVDGCRGGWFAVLLDAESGRVDGRFRPDFSGVLELAGDVKAIGVDIPNYKILRTTGGRATPTAAP